MTEHLQQLKALFDELLKEHAEALAQINTEWGDGKDEPSPDDTKKVEEYRQKFNYSYDKLKERILKTIDNIYSAR